jgi:4a-hydroxytetrahydrobiopterin dehydratase
MPKMTQDEISGSLARSPEWSELNGQIQRTFQFDTFLEAMAFVNRIADYSEEVQHHPEMLIRYNKVTLTVSTHDAGGITEKDFELAGHADGLLAV